MKLWQHEKSGRLCWSGRPLNPEKFRQLAVMTEDELSPAVNDDDYRWWLQNSMRIGSVRYGPIVAVSTSIEYA